MLWNSLCPVEKGNWCMINVLRLLWERCTGKYFKLKNNTRNHVKNEIKNLIWLQIWKNIFYSVIGGWYM